MKSLRVIDKTIKYRYGICLALFFFMVVMQFHGISISQWDQYYSRDIQTTYYGELRPITSDVWAVVIPEVLSQADNGFPLWNYELASNGMNAMLAHIPAADITMIIGLPVFWGYLLFGVHYGIAWFYWFRILGLFLSGFEIIRYLTKNNKISLIGALLISCSPIVLWWGGHILPEVLLYAQMMIAGGICYIENHHSWKKKILSICVVISSSIGFIITLYPAMQVSVGIIVLLFAFFVIKDNRKSLHFTSKDVLLLIFMAGSIVFLVARILIISKDDIMALLSTSFPGSRLEVGGTGTGIHIFYSVFQIFLPFAQAVGPTNNCEAAQFIPLWIAAIFATPFVMRSNKAIRNRNLIVALYIYLCFCVAWLLFSFPAWFAKLTLFSNVTNNRLLWAIGLLAILLSCAFVSINSIQVKRSHCFYISTLGALIVLLSIQRGADYNSYLNKYPFLYLIGIAFVFVLTYSIVAKNKKIFAIVSVIFAMVNIICINPICKGVYSITEKNIYSAIQEIAEKDPSANWIYAESYPYGNFLSACGVKCLNASNYYLDSQKWSKIDPAGEHIDKYNRYCQVGVALGYSTQYELLSPDNLQMTLSGEDLVKLDCDYVVSNSDISQFMQVYDGLLEEVTSIDNTTIYRVEDIQTLQKMFYDGTLSGDLIPAQPLRTGMQYQQKFIANGTRLNKLGILFGTYGRINHSKIRVSIYGDEGVVLDKEFELSELVDNSIAFFSLDSAHVSAGKEYTIEFRAIGDSESDFVTVYQSESEGSYAIQIIGE